MHAPFVKVPRWHEKDGKYTMERAIQRHHIHKSINFSIYTILQEQVILDGEKRNSHVRHIISVVLKGGSIVGYVLQSFLKKYNAIMAGLGASCIV